MLKILIVFYDFMYKKKKNKNNRLFLFVNNTTKVNNILFSIDRVRISLISDKYNTKFNVFHTYTRYINGEICRFVE